MGSKWDTICIDDIKLPEKYSCVGGPFGSSLSQKHYTDSGVPVIRGVNLSGDTFSETGFVFVSQDKSNELRRNMAFRGDLVFTQRGTLGQVALIPEDSKYERYIISQSQMKLTVNTQQADPYFIYTYFRTNEAKVLIEKSAIVGGVPHINLGILKAFKLRLPPLSEQKRISEISKSIDSKINLNRQINQTLEQMAQTLFKSWFVDFDPVVDNALDAGFFEQDLEFSDELLRRAEARRNVHASANYSPLPYAIRQQFPVAFELCSEPFLGLRGWVPRGWAITTVGDVFIVKGGSTPSTTNPEFWERGDIHWTTPKDLSGSKDKILLKTERKITSAGLQKITSGLLPKETVLMSSRAPVGYLALTKINTAINQGYIAITDTKGLSPEFTLYWLDSNMEKIKSMSGGTTFAEISKKTFRSIQLVIPSIDVVNSFSTTVGAYLSKITNNSEECSTLADLREYLLPKLINGELGINS